jgi:hypothetical protein
MLVLIVLIVSILVFRGLGFAGVSALASWPAAVRDGLAIMLLLGASARFTPVKEDLIRALILFFVAVLPANIHAARAGITLRGRPPTPLWLRVPMQFLFIALAWWSTR